MRRTPTKLTPSLPHTWADTSSCLLRIFPPLERPEGQTGPVLFPGVLGWPGRVRRDLVPAKSWPASASLEQQMASPHCVVCVHLYPHTFPAGIPSCPTGTHWQREAGCATAIFTWLYSDCRNCEVLPRAEPCQGWGWTTRACTKASWTPLPRQHHLT